MRMRSLLTLAFASCALAAPPALADVVPPEPDSCPDGARPSTCHGGPYCRPKACTSDSDCTGGDECREISYCTGIINCAGLLPPDTDPSDFDQTKVNSLCPAGGTCSSGACETLKVCAAPATSEPEPEVGEDTGTPAKKERSSCDAGGGSAPWLLAALVLVALGLRRQRQRAV